MSSHPLTILVTDSSYKHAVGIIRSLGRQGHRIIAASHSKLSAGRFSRYAYRAVVLPSPASDPVGYASQIQRESQEHGVDLIIPVGFASCDALAHDPEVRQASSARVALTTAEGFDRAADKWEMNQRAKSLGLAVPDSLLASDTGSMRYFADEHPHSVCKSRRESLGKGATRLYAGPAPEAFESQLRDLLHGRDPERYLVQEYVPGHGIGYMAMCIEGRIVREFTHRRLREWPPDGGYATAAIATDDLELREQGRRLVASLEWHGPAMVEFRRGERGTYFIEFNPKFWGSLELALASGADFPGDLCEWATGHDLTARPLPTHSIGQRFWWPWRGDLRRLFRSPGDIGRVSLDMISPSVRSNWSWHDPVPNFIEIGAELLYPLRHHD